MAVVHPMEDESRHALSKECDLHLLERVSRVNTVQDSHNQRNQNAGMRGWMDVKAATHSSSSS